MDEWELAIQQITDDLKSGHYEQALSKIVASEVLAAQDGERLMDLAELYFQLGHVEDAERITDKLLQSVHGTIEPLLLKVEIAIQRESWDEAIQWLEEARDMDADHPEILVASADCYRAMGLPEVATTYLEQLVEQHPTAPYYWLALGLTQLENGQAHAAINSLTRAYELDDQDADIAEGLARALIEVGEWEASLPYLTAALTMHPDHTELALTKAVLHYRLGETDDAIDQLIRLTQSEPENSDILAQLGEIQLALGRIVDAKKSWEKVHSLNPHDSHALLALGRIALREQKWQVALDHFHEALEMGDERDDVLIGIAESYQEMGKWREALQYYEQIGTDIDGRPLPAGIYRNMAYCHTQLEAYEAAIACLEKERRTSDDPALYNELADLYWLTGQRKDACNCWHTSLTADPNQWDVAELYERNCISEQ